MKSIEAMLWDFIVNNNIATEDELRLVDVITCGLTESTMNDIIFTRTGYRNYGQCVTDENYSGTDELDSYYCLDEEEEEEDQAKKLQVSVLYACLFPF